MDLKSIINADSSSTASSRPPPPLPPPTRQQPVQSYQGYQQQQSPGAPIPPQQYGGRYDGRPPQPPPIRPPSHQTMGSPSRSISYHSAQSPYGTTPSSASAGGNQYPFPPSDPQSRPLSIQSTHSQYSQRTVTGPPPVTQNPIQPGPAPATPTGAGLTNTYGYPQYQHTPSSQPSYAPLPSQSHVQAYPRDGYPNVHNQNSIQRNTYPPIAQQSQPATPLGPPPSLSRASTMRREGSMSYPYDHQRTQSGSSYGHSPKSAQSSATMERNGSVPLGASPRGSISRPPPPIQSQSYVSEGNRERSLSVSPKTRLIDPEPPRMVMPMALGQEQQRRWSKSMDVESAPPPFYDPYKESRPVQPTQSQPSPPNIAEHANGLNPIALPNQYDSEAARYPDNHGTVQTQSRMPERFYETSTLPRGPSGTDRPQPPILNTQGPPILGKPPLSPSAPHDMLFDQSVVHNASHTPPAIAHAPKFVARPAVATAQTPPATAHSATTSFGHSTPQTPVSSHRPIMATEVSNQSFRHTPTTYPPTIKREHSSPSAPQTPMAKSPPAQSSLTKKQEHMQHSPRPSTPSDERPAKRSRSAEVPIWAQKFNRGQPPKKVIFDKSAVRNTQTSRATSSAPPGAPPSASKAATNGHLAVKPTQQLLSSVAPLPNFSNDAPLGPLEVSIANMQPFEELTRAISDFLFTQIVIRPDIGSISASGTPTGPAVLEIEAKLGQLIDPDTGLRFSLPIITESVLDHIMLEGRRRPHFKSIMTESQHQSFNTYLNNCVKESYSSAQPQSTTPRVPVTYKHTKERDTFYELPAPKEALLPQSVLDNMGRRDPKIRVTTAKNDNTLLAQIIKCRLADMDVISPRTKFDWRISVNLEMNWEGDVSELVERTKSNHAHANANGANGNAGAMRSRDKDRMTYRHCGVYQIDLTQVTPADATSHADKEHELEIELNAQELKRQGKLLQSRAENRYADLVRGFVDNVRLLARQ